MFFIGTKTKISDQQMCKKVVPLEKADRSLVVASWTVTQKGSFADDTLFFPNHTKTSMMLAVTLTFVPARSIGGNEPGTDRFYAKVGRGWRWWWWSE